MKVGECRRGDNVEEFCKDLSKRKKGDVEEI